jgi:hypothetical protein
MCSLTAFALFYELWNLLEHLVPLATCQCTVNRRHKLLRKFPLALQSFALLLKEASMDLESYM